MKKKIEKLYLFLFLNCVLLNLSVEGQNQNEIIFNFQKKSSFNLSDNQFSPPFSTSSINHSLIDPKPVSFFVPERQYNKKRFWGIFGTGNAAYVTSMVVLNKFWYSDYEKSSFHFTNDGVNWLQIDKAGHAWTAYTESFYAYDLYRWSGLSKNKSLWLACISATIYQGSIEILDGHSAQWGASWGDLLANSSGVALFGIQEALWDEQKIRLKFSSRKQNYQNFDPLIQERATSLYGSNFWERTLKDYNGQIYWLSFNPFQRIKAYPKWLNWAVGYGANNLFGAVENSWESNGQMVDFTNLERNRQFYLSLDIDLSKIQTKSPFLNWILHSINIVKIPAPTLVLENGRLAWHSPF